MIRLLCIAYFKGTVSRDFLLQIFYESVSPRPLIVPLAPFRKFAKVCGYICGSRYTIINDTGSTLTIDAIDTGGKFTAGVNDTGGNIFLEITLTAMTPAANGVDDTSVKLYFIQHCFICRPQIPLIWRMLGLNMCSCTFAVRRSNHKARSHHNTDGSHPQLC
jgi:hypothetical protein